MSENKKIRTHESGKGKNSSARTHNACVCEVAAPLKTWALTHARLVHRRMRVRSENYICLVTSAPRERRSFGRSS